MGNSINLIQGQKYKVIKPFTDYDKHVHEPGETWTYVETNFLPYEDGLTVHLTLDGNPKILVFRLQWRREEQADIIENFKEYVVAV